MKIPKFGFLCPGKFVYIVKGNHKTIFIHKEFSLFYICDSYLRERMSLNSTQKQRESETVSLLLMTTKSIINKGHAVIMGSSLYQLETKKCWIKYILNLKNKKGIWNQK